MRKLQLTAAIFAVAGWLMVPLPASSFDGFVEHESSFMFPGDDHFGPLASSALFRTYTDSSCQNFLADVSGVQSLTNLIGLGIVNSYREEQGGGWGPCISVP